MMKKHLHILVKLSALIQKNVEALNSLGGIYRRLKKYDDSISVLEQAVISDESKRPVVLQLGLYIQADGEI